MLGSKSAAIVNATTMNEYWMFQKAVYPPQKQWTSISFLQWLQYSTLNFCVQPPCVPMVHSRHLHTPCIGCDSGARNTSGRAPPDLEWSCGVPKILDALATPQSPPAFNQSRIFRKPSTYAELEGWSKANGIFVGQLQSCGWFPAETNLKFLEVSVPNHPKQQISFKKSSIQVVEVFFSYTIYTLFKKTPKMGTATIPVTQGLNDCDCLERLSTSAPKRQQHLHGSKPQAPSAASRFIALI